MKNSHTVMWFIWVLFWSIYIIYWNSSPPLLLKADTMKEKVERKFRLRLKPDFRKYFFIY